MNPTGSWVLASGLALGSCLGGFLAGFLLAKGWRRNVRGRHGRCQGLLQAMERARDAAELANQGLQQAMEELERAAGTDRLTGAWNRRRFEEAAAAEMALAQRRRDPVSLLIFDLDFFKRVNDTFGHAAGDMVLTRAAQAVREQLRASDALVRWGGEEFIVLCPATRLEGAQGLAEKIRACIAEQTFPEIGQVTVSLGVAEYALGEDLAAWINRADEALYRAKEGGRNRVEVGGSGPGLEAGPSSTLLELIWEEAYTSGQVTIDAQHQKLFALANALLGAASSGQPASEVSVRLKTLLAHTAQHFHDEESLLAQAGFRDLASHAAEHQRLLKAAQRFQGDVEGGRLDLAQLVGFLTMDLVRGHLLVEDRHYFACFQEPGRSGS